MNVNAEPGAMLRGFCIQTDRVNPRWSIYFDDETDVEPFLEWVAADQSRADTWAMLREHHGCDDRRLLQLALTDPKYGWTVA